MKVPFTMRRSAATLIPVVVLAAGCACMNEPVDTAPARARVPVMPALDAASKQRVEHRLRGKREIAAKPNVEHQLRSEADENGPPSAAQIFRAHEQRRVVERETALRGVAKSAGLQPSQWQSLGPGNVAGRIRAIAIDPRNARRVLVGAATGGLWLSEDAGATWRTFSDFLPNLSITSIAVDPVNPDTIYLGTGEASQGFVGVGVFKSTNNGATFRHLPPTNPDTNPDWRFVNRLAVHPGQPSIVLAGVTTNEFVVGAIYRSTDGGERWTKVSDVKTLDLAFDPANPGNALAGLDDGSIAYSRDAGATWTKTAPLVATPSGRGGTARAEIAFARSVPGLVFASVDNARGEVWRSNDSGETWTKVSTPGHLRAQGNYDNAIWVSPIDPNHVIVGGVELHQSFDGGVTFATIARSGLEPAAPHVDHHAIVSPPDFGPSNQAIFNGNDGGVYWTANVRTVSSTGAGWINANNGLNVTQFYSGAGRAGGRITGGTQDNGSLVLSQGQWRFWEGGDGGYTAVDPTVDGLIYGSIYYLAIFRSTNGGTTRSYICKGITEAYKPENNADFYCGSGTSERANFIAPFVLDPGNPARMLAGGDSLWTSDNVRAAQPAWRAIKAPSPVDQNYINAIAVHEGNGNVVWVGHNNGEVHRSIDALSAAPTWSRVGQGIIPARLVRRILVDRDNPNRVIVAVTGFTPNNLWQTIDGGTTWSSITGNLPAAPIFDVERHPTRPSWLYVATSVGVYTSEDGGATWSTTNEGPANIRVFELFWLDDTTLAAATFGRGMWKVNVAGGDPANYQDLWWAGAAENGWGMSITQHGSAIFGAFFIYDDQGRQQWVVMPGGSWNAGFTAFSGALYIPTGTYFGSYEASRLVAGASVGNATITFTSASTATFDYTINGITGRKSIQRQLFGPPDSTPVATYGDLWWGGSTENGWGVAINQQYRSFFSVWYTYDASGRTTWYVIPAGAWTSTNTYTGTAYRTTGSAWLGVPYNPAALVPLEAGTVTFRFLDRDNAMMTYTVDGVTQTKPITRQPF